MALSTQSGMARVLLFIISASSLLSSGAKRVTMPQELETFELAWQPWKFFNYSSPSAAKYCKDAYCLRCSEPEEFTVHPYKTCRSRWGKPPQLSSSQNRTSLPASLGSIATLEVASSLYEFDSLLVCIAAERVKLSASNFQVISVTEGGTLSSASGKTVVHPPPQDSSKTFFEAVGELGKSGSGTQIVNNPLSFAAIEFGTLDDFLANDQYYAESFKYMRYEEFYSNPETASIAKHLVKRPHGQANCALLSSQGWKTKTRYEIEIGLNTTGGAPIWVAPVKVELMSSIPPGMTDGKILRPFGDDVQWLLTSVRGPKTGSVCQDVSGSAPKQSASECDAGSGHVWTPNGKHCVFCPRLADLVLDAKCNATNHSVSPRLSAHQIGNWTANWTNVQGGEFNCCPANAMPQLVGDKACGALVSPLVNDVAVSFEDALKGELPRLLCDRFGYLMTAFEEAACPLSCVTSGPIGSPDCYCPRQMFPLPNMSFVTDAYLARGMLGDFLWQGKILFDDYSLVKARQVMRLLGLDIDGRRTRSVTRQRGLGGIWSDPDNDGKADFYDMYNIFSDFTRNGGDGLSSTVLEEQSSGQIAGSVSNNVNIAVHDERGKVDDFDSLYLLSINLRIMGLLLYEKALSTSPYACPRIFDPSTDNASAPVLPTMRDVYFPLFGHYPDEL